MFLNVWLFTYDLFNFLNRNALVTPLPSVFKSMIIVTGGKRGESMVNLTIIVIGATWWPEDELNLQSRTHRLPTLYNNPNYS